MLQANTSWTALFTVLVGLSVPLDADAATLTVGGGGTFTSIQAAIDAAVAGDIVEVRPGTYMENVNFRGKAITVQSVGGSSVTTIDARGAGSAVTFGTGETNNSILLGFTLKGGANSGVNIFLNAAPTIRECRITGNRGDNGGGLNVWGPAVIMNNVIEANEANKGGGLYVNNTGVAVKNNVIRGNQAGSGGGAYVVAGGITSSTFENNTASGQGGGAYMSAGTTLVNDLFVGNSGTYGGGVHVATGTTVRLTNVTLANNRAPGTFGAGGGVHIASGAGASLRNLIVAFNTASLGGGIYSDGSNPGQFYLDVFGNTPTDFAGNAVGSPGANGNISADPRFSTAYPFSLLNGSPCVDTGDPARAYNDPDDSLNDMGAFGGPDASWAPYADTDADGIDLANGDCDDQDALNFPGNAEVCDGQDNNCDGVADEGLNDDDDGDGLSECEGDCVDSEAGVFPGNVEIPDDGIDQDCDGQDASDGPSCSSTTTTGGTGLGLAMLSLAAVGVLRRRRG